VSDILMPVMDGYTLCRHWRSDERLRKIPFIFYTATYTEKKDEELALSLGADRFVIKPQEPEALMGIMREVLSASGPGAARPASGAVRSEGEFLKDYNDSLFRKLEKKMADLERSNQELKESMESQKRLEEQLRQVQKLEAVGRFSAGIAHDFNNILTVILGFGDMLRASVKQQESQLQMLDQILAAAGRAQGLTRSLLAFSRMQVMKPLPLDLNECIGNVETFLRRVIGEDVKLITSCSREAVPVVADAGQIEQVLMNLATNARDAMPEGGVLSIGTGVIAIDEEFVHLHGYGAPGRYAVLTVSDTGVGMDEATRRRIFEPFFTTKDAGKGTGLGLPIIYGIVQQHQGYVTVYSEPRQGSTFKILLPLRPGAAAVREEASRRQALRGGRETILVVDDEPSVRQYLEMFLTSLGYAVLLAQDGQEAVEIFRERGRQVDLVLMDIILPRRNGQEAARAIRECASGAKIVFTSGYPAELIHERRLLEDGEVLLMKPLTPTELAVTVRATLDGAAAK
jgi:signal transduction histidine kinase